MLDPVSAAIIAGGTLGASYLGSKGGGGKVSQYPTMDPGQMDLLNKLTELLGGQLGQGITPYGGPRVPPVSPLQQGGFDIMGGMMPMAGEGQTVMAEAFGRYQPDLAGQYQEMGGEALERVLQDYDPDRITQVMKPVGDYAESFYKDQIMPAVMEHYASRGTADSGAAMRSLGREGKNLALGLSSQFAPYQFQGYESQQNRQLQGVPEAYRMGMMGPDVLNQIIAGAGRFPMDIATSGIGAGGIERGITGEQFGAGQDVWTEAQPWANPWMNFMPTALGTQSVENVYQEGGPNMASLMMPAFGSMMGSYMGNQLTPGGGFTPNNPMNYNQLDPFQQQLFRSTATVPR